MQPGIVLDIVLVVVLVAFLVRGLRTGFTGTVGSLIGLVVGGVAAFFAIPLVASWVTLSEWRGAAAACAALVLLAAGFAIGSAVGGIARSQVDRTPLRIVDRLLGAALNAVVTALVFIMAAVGIGSLGVPVLSLAAGSSTVIRSIEALTPDPMDAVLAQLRSTVVGGSAQRVIEAFNGTQELPGIPEIDTGTDAFRTARASVVRVSGNADGCGESLTGSGFVFADGLVLTNAHVLAGVREPVVEAQGEIPHAGTIVYFDPVDDLAVVRVDALAARPLRLAANPSAGSAVVVAGYPYGGPFTSNAAAVVSVGTTIVPDIHGASPAPRQVVTITGAVRPGNSGGPLLTERGEVVGVVFARDAGAAPIGYALAMDEVLPVVADAGTLRAPVSSGGCASE